MSNEFNQITEKVLKAINEQNKGLENLEDKIEKITIEKVKEFLSNEDIAIDDSPSESKGETLLLKGIENRLKTLEESLKNSPNNGDINEKLLSLEQENKELKEKLIVLEESLNENNLFCKKLEEKLQLLEESNKITNDIKENDTKLEKSDLDRKDLAIKKDGKVVNIVINV